MPYTETTPRCNSRKTTRPDELKDIPEAAPGPHAGPGYCGRPAGEGTSHLGSGRCYRHFGRNPVGTAVHSFKHGKYSKYVPARYLEDYDQGLNDPTIQNEQKNELAAMHALWVEAWKRLDDGTESGEAWRRVQRKGAEIEGLLGDFVSAREMESADAGIKLDELIESLDRLLSLIRHGAGQEHARGELVDLMQKRAKLMRVKQQGERTVPVEVFGLYQVRVAVILVETIKDRKLLSELLTKLRTESLPAEELAGVTGMRRADGRAARAEVEGAVDQAGVKVIDVEGKRVED